MTIMGNYNGLRDPALVSERSFLLCIRLSNGS